mgnify:CR=1 FL=1
MYGFVCIVMYAYVCVVIYGYAWVCKGYVWLYMAVYGNVGLCRAMYGCVWLCMAMCGCVWQCMAMHGYFRDIRISVWQCRAMYSCVGLCDQIHSSLVDILFYFTLFYFSSQICWNGNKGSCVVIFVSHTQTRCSYVIWAYFRA